MSRIALSASGAVPDVTEGPGFISLLLFSSFLLFSFVNSFADISLELLVFVRVLTSHFFFSLVFILSVSGTN